MKKVYSPQLNEVFTVVDENNSAYITEEGAYLSKKMAKKWEEIHYGGCKITLPHFDGFDDESDDFPIHKLDNCGIEVPLYKGEIQETSYGWMITPPEADMEELKKKYELDMFDKLFCRQLKDRDHCVNLNFYD